MGVTLFPEAGLPAGMVMPYAGTAPPVGWLVCDGALLAVAEYPTLFAAIQYTYGGSGATFNLPNLKGKVIVGVNDAEAEFNLIGKVGGSKTSTAPHTHDLANHGHAHSAAGPSDNVTNTINWRETNGHWPSTNTTGTVSHWHQHNMSHWHLATLAQIGYSGDGNHHHAAGITSHAAEGPSHGGTGGHGAIPVNIDGTARGGHGGDNKTGNPDTNHSHDLQNHWHTIPQHDHGMKSHTHANTIGNPTNNTSGASSAALTSGNLQPYLALNYLIKT